ncbi:uncharacterized protein [Palaemon carinicauda]|uniref:uncharacterized protein n=1 Tax=Palaemon carinicauda TaxID=392227 RepID=UPI0035B6352B
MILMFREKPFGLTADISKAFLRIEIVTEQRDFCRFLFSEDPEMTRIVAYRFKVILFGATSSPYLLNQTIQHHLDSQSSRFVSTPKTSFYIDDFQRCYVNLKDLLSERPLIEALMLKANMPLAKWTTNAPLNGDFTKRGIQDYLSFEWNTVNDTLNVILPPELEISKLFIQKLWMTDKGWDTPIDPEPVQELSDIIKRYKGLEQIKVPRNAHDGSQPALHNFDDASKLAFGVAAYTVTQEATRAVALEVTSSLTVIEFWSIWCATLSLT